MSEIDIHADDYGVSVNTSLKILECIKKGKLDSISIIPNMNTFDKCMEMLHNEWEKLQKKPKISIHLDLIDGYSLAGKDAYLLCNKEGYCKISWGKLFMISCIPGKLHKELEKELKIEIKAQIEKCSSRLPDYNRLRIDSHMHTHMIPIVAKALLEVIDEEQYQVEFIRVAREPLSVFARNTSLYLSYSPINIMKNVILNICAGNFEKKLKNKKIKYGLLWGLVMSGYMDLKRVNLLKNSMIAYAKSKDKDLEILFHPGQMTEDEITPQHCKSDVYAFYLSKDRDVERNAVINY